MYKITTNNGVSHIGFTTFVSFERKSNYITYKTAGSPCYWDYWNGEEALNGLRIGARFVLTVGDREFEFSVGHTIDPVPSYPEETREAAIDELYDSWLKRVTEKALELFDGLFEPRTSNNINIPEITKELREIEFVEKPIVGNTDIEDTEHVFSNPIQDGFVGSHFDFNLEEEFKVGDRVRLIDDEEELLQVGAPASVAGEEGVIGWIVDESYAIEFDGENTWWVTKPLIEKVEAEKAEPLVYACEFEEEEGVAAFYYPVFEVGDRVRLTNDEKDLVGISPSYVGEIGTIEYRYDYSNDSPDFTVRLDNGRYCYVKARYLRPVFYVGDKVRLTDDEDALITLFISTKYHGETGTIVNVKDPSIYSRNIHVKMDKDGFLYYLTSDLLEKI